VLNKMLKDNPNSLLYIHPWNHASFEPALDSYFMKVYYAIRHNKIGNGTGYDGGYTLGRMTKGVHDCTGENCDYQSSCCELILKANGNAVKTWKFWRRKRRITFIYTNTLALHYLAFHRDEIPQSELDKIDNFLDDPPEDFKPSFKKCIKIATPQNRN